eukprot:GHVH01001388.1.p1 GENE.GHVH01001388.1~~GHVH01001388.1.p1  ORF type:complete len:161 (+),score=18.45 GHVH01001388.1:60-542(+)
MGSNISSCCAQENDDSALEHQLDGSKKDKGLRLTNSYDHRQLGISVADCEHLLQELKGGIEMNIVLAVGHGLKCILRYNPDSKAIVIMRGDNRRVLALSSITRILHTEEQLSRVETQATLDSHCCAMLLLTGTCITCRFFKEIDCKSFVSVIGTMLNDLS